MLCTFVYQSNEAEIKTFQKMNTCTVTFRKIADAQPMGEYKPTSVDANKSTVDFRLIQVGPKVITWTNGATQKVTDAKFNKLTKAHTWATDF